MVVALIIACIAIVLFCNRQTSLRGQPKPVSRDDFSLGKTTSFFLMEECVDNQDTHHRSSNEFHVAVEQTEAETECFEEEF